jgi:hypothetical protein
VSLSPLRRRGERWGGVARWGERGGVPAPSAATPSKSKPSEAPTLSGAHDGDGAPQVASKMLGGASQTVSNNSHKM